MKKIIWKTMWIWVMVFCITKATCFMQTVFAAESAAFVSDDAHTEGETIRIACVGDSLTFGYVSGNPQTKSYPVRLQEMLGDGYTVMNFGRNSATLLTGTDLAYEDQQEYQNSLASDPDIVIIMLGTNDSKAKYWEEGGREKFAEDARKLVSTYQNLPSKPEVIFASSPACLYALKTDIRGNIIEDEIVPMQRKLAKENGWKFIDMFARTSEKDFLYHSDGVHFLDAGYFYEAECMYEAVTGEAFLPEALPLADIRGLTQQHGNEALYAADNDYTTIWHSAWEPAAPRQDHVLILELRERSLVEGIRYLPRQDKATNGIITEYEIQISNDGGKSYTKAAEGTWNADASWKQAQFEKPAAATHLKILAKAGAGGHSSAAEIRVDGSAYTPQSPAEARECLQADYEAYERNYTDETLYEASAWKLFRENMQAVQKRMEQEDLSLAEAAVLSQNLREAVLSLLKKETEVLDIKKAMQRKFYIEEDGTILPYRMYLPEGYSPEKKYPLVLFLHGAGERGSTNTAQLTNSNKDFFERMLGSERNDYPAIIVAPQCPNNEQWVDTPWADGCYRMQEVAKSNEMKAVEGLLASLMETYSINQNRLYAVGFSMGAFGVWDLMMRNPNLLAAAVPIAGAGDPAQAENIKDVSIWCFHGADDPTVPCETSTPVMAAALQEAGSNRIRYTEYPAGTYEDGHLIASGVYAEDELLPWLFEQRIEMDTAELSNAISQAEQKNPADYTAESYRQFSEALMNAKEVLSDDSAQQEQIDDALQKLNGAAGRLEKRPKEPLKPKPMEVPQIFGTIRKAANIFVSWNAVSHASGYEVSYSISGTYKTAAVAGGAVTSCVIEGTDGNSVYTFRIRAYQDVNGQRYYTDYSKWNATSVSIPKPKLSSLKKAGKHIRVKWKKVSGATGYQIMRKIGKKGKFKTIATIKKGKTIKYTDKKVKKGKKYYYKICAVVTSGTNTSVGPYSAVKNVKR